MKVKIRTRMEQRKADRARARRAALRALKKAKKAAELSNTKLSNWEDEFLDSVEKRVDRYGRAFRDPERGAPGAALSMLQSQKLREISRKAKNPPQKRRDGPRGTMA